MQIGKFTASRTHGGIMIFSASAHYSLLRKSFVGGCRFPEDIHNICVFCITSCEEKTFQTRLLVFPLYMNEGETRLIIRI